MNQPTLRFFPRFATAARRTFIVFFFTFPLLLIMLPPDVLGDTVVAVYAAALAVVAFIIWRRVGRGPAQPASSMPARKTGIIHYLRTRPRPWLWALIGIPLLVFMLYFTGLFVGVLFALWRERFFITITILFALWAGRKFTKIKIFAVVKITLPRAWFALVWVSLVSFAIFSKSTNPEACEKYASRPGVKLVFSLKDVEAVPELRGSFPYMAIPDTGGRTLFASFKPISHQGGVLARIDLPAAPGQGTSVKILMAAGKGSGPAMVQAIAYDPGTYRLFAPVSDIADYRLLEIDCSAGRFDLIRAIPLPGEPGDIAVDPARHILHIALKPHRLIGFSLPGLVKIYDMEAPVLGGIDFIAPDPRGEKVYVSTVGLHVAAVRPGRAGYVRRLMITSFGLAVSGGPAPRLFAASPGLDTLYVLDPATLATEHTIHLGGGLRALCPDPARNLVYAASYASGMLHIIDSAASPPALASSVPLGKLLRKITIDPASEKVFATSSCGIFEISPEKLN